MRTSKVGIVSAAVLVVVAVIGLGIAQAGESYPAGEVTEGQTPQSAISPADDVQMENPSETGSLPAESAADSPKVEYVERVWKGDIDGH